MSLPTRVWVWKDQGGNLKVSIVKPTMASEAREYSLMLGREQIEKLATAEGVDRDVWVTNLSRIVQTQRKRIARLEQQVALLKSGQQQHVIP